MFVAESEIRATRSDKLHHCHVKILPASWFEVTHQESGMATDRTYHPGNFDIVVMAMVDVP